MSKKIELTATDMTAIREGTEEYLTNKGANLYTEETYYQAVEYYRLAATMGEVQAISNLGYCYLYGRDIEANTSLAIAYFVIAANNKNIDAAYKLGDIYSSDKWGVKDKELSNYYYTYAASLIIGEGWKHGEPIFWCDELEEYPSLCYAIARETFIDGSMPTDLKISYQFLKFAEIGYKSAIENGNLMYEKAYDSVLKLLQDEKYNRIRNEYDIIFSKDDYE